MAMLQDWIFLFFLFLENSLKPRVFRLTADHIGQNNFNNSLSRDSEARSTVDEFPWPKYRIGHGPTLAVDSYVELSVVGATDHKGLVALAGISVEGSAALCAGSLISKFHILTSAYCVEHIPGTLAVFSGQAREINTTSAHPWPGETILDSKYVIGCVTEKIFHPCYRKPTCSGTKCVPKSWRYDLAIVRTDEDLTKAGVEITGGNYSNFGNNVVKSCSVFGFRSASRNSSQTNVFDQFLGVTRRVNATRANFPCDDWNSMVNGLIKSVEGHFANLPGQELTGGQLICDSALTGVLMGKIEGRYCQVIDHQEKNCGEPIWLGFTYLYPYRKWIRSALG